MKKNRPVFLDLTKIRFPVAAISSILHRISGLIVFLLIPFILWMFDKAKTQSGFDSLSADLHSPILKFILWGLIACLLYHLTAGIRHLFMDMKIGEGKKAGQVTAWLSIIISAILIIIAGGFLWL